jgi:hypothetical protein
MMQIFQIKRFEHTIFSLNILNIMTQNFKAGWIAADNEPGVFIPFYASF